MISPNKCGECGAELALRYQVSDRDFYIENNELKEDTNTWFEPTFIVHCYEDFEHDIEKNLSEEQLDELAKWKERLAEEAIKKFNI